MSCIDPSPTAPLRIGTRGSPLALAQAYETRDRLIKSRGLSEDSFEIKVIKVTGDAIQDRPLSAIGGKGLFTREIEEELLAGTIDIAVHSTKDMPTQQPEGLVLDCFLPREDPRDALISHQFHSIDALPKGATLGTSSLRRRAQILARRPDLNIVEFRGNVQTRLRKLESGIADASFLACAGLERLGMLADLPAYPIDVDEMLPAVAQGVIGIERRSDDRKTAELLESIHHPETAIAMAAERRFLEILDGSCQTPIAGLARISGEEITLRGEILRPDGRERYSGERTGPAGQAEILGETLAKELLDQAGPGFF